MPTPSSSSNIFLKGMKRIIPDNRYNSSFEKDREKVKADTLAYGVKVAKATGHRWV